MVPGQVAHPRQCKAEGQDRQVTCTIKMDMAFK